MVEIYCLTNLHARTQLIECLIYNMCAHADYKNLLASLLGNVLFKMLIDSLQCGAKRVRGEYRTSSIQLFIRSILIMF